MGAREEIIKHFNECISRSIEEKPRDKAATKIRDMRGFAGEAALYRLNPPYRYENYGDGETEYIEEIVISSAFVISSGPEVLAFRYNKHCKYVPGESADGVSNWGEVAGMRGIISHEELLKVMGYEIVC